MTNNQRFAAELVALLAVGAAVVAKAGPQAPGGQPPAEVVRARMFELVDKEGRACATLRKSEKAFFGIPGGVTLTLHSAQPKPDGLPHGSMALAVAEDGTQGVFLINHKNHTALALMLGTDGTPKILLSGKDGKTRTVEP